VQARQAWNLRTSAGFDRAEVLLGRALELQPNLARAMAAQADVWLIRDTQEARIGKFNQRSSPELIRSLAKVDEALALDGNAAEAYASRGFARMMSWRLAEAQTDLRRAVAINPNYAVAHHWLGDALLNDGQIDHALAELSLASQLDPLSHRTANRYSRALLDAGRPGAALRVIEGALKIQPDSNVSVDSKVEALWRLGRSDEALALAVVPRTQSGTSLHTRSLILAATGRAKQAEAELTRLEASDPGRFFTLIALGRTDEALAFLQSDRVTILLMSIFCYAPEYDAVRSDPRVVSYLARTGLTEAHARAQAWRKAHPPEKPAAK
jgi:tetratricopeptide (TPR) repeat protein